MVRGGSRRREAAVDAVFEAEGVRERGAGTARGAGMVVDRRGGTDGRC